MKSHGLEMIGTLKVETVATLPTWTVSDKGREIYVEDEDKRYYGDNTEWVDYGDSGSNSASGALLLTSNKWNKAQYSTSECISSSSGELFWDLEDSQIATTTLTEDTILYVSNIPNGLNYCTLKILNAGIYTLSYDTNSYWIDDIPPIITPSGIDILTFFSDETYMYGTVLQNYII